MLLVDNRKWGAREDDLLYEVRTSAATVGVCIGADVHEPLNEHWHTQHSPITDRSTQPDNETKS